MISKLNNLPRQHIVVLNKLDQKRELSSATLLYLSDAELLDLGFMEKTTTPYGIGPKYFFDPDFGVCKYESGKRVNLIEMADIVEVQRVLADFAMEYINEYEVGTTNDKAFAVPVFSDFSSANNYFNMLFIGNDENGIEMTSEYWESLVRVSNDVEFQMNLANRVEE